MTTSLLAGDLKLIQDTAIEGESFVDVVIGTRTIQGGVMETTGKDVLVNQGLGGISGRQIIVIVATTDMPTELVANGTPITVDGRAMKIRDYFPVDHGEITHIFCELDV